MQKQLVVFGWFLLCCATWAQQPSASGPGTLHRTIRITGDPAIAVLLNRWEDQFRIQYPNVSFENRLTGPASAMAGLYTRVADLAFAGHELLTSESMAFEWIFHYKALPIEVTSGSLDGPSFAPAFLVNGRNPLSTLTIAQANALLSCEHPNKTTLTWGDLGLKDEWENQPVHVYSYEPESEVGVFIRRKILKNSYKWSCEMKTFGETKPESVDDGSRQTLDALRADRYGIAVSKADYSGDDLKALSLAASDSSLPIAPSTQSVIDRTYPLARPFFLYINREPGKPTDEVVPSFLRFILSKEGQQEVVSFSKYLPLSEPIVREQLRKLD